MDFDDRVTIFALDPKPSLRHRSPVSPSTSIRLDNVNHAPSQPEVTTKRTRPPLLKPKVPRVCDPDDEYEWWYSIDFCNGRSYCFAFSETKNEVFTILRVREQAIFELDRPEPYALNIFDALAWEKSLFLVYRHFPGVSLSRIYWKKPTAHRDFKMICKQVSNSKVKTSAYAYRRYVV
jgi:hypothetical protein